VDWSVAPETAAFADGIASGYITQFTVAPEPATLALLGLGLAACAIRRRKRAAATESRRAMWRSSTTVAN
jgi:hypothetical protein